MLLRAVSKHVKDQNWFAVAIDFFIVVIGVYIGIQVSNWNAKRIDIERGEYFSARLIQDIRREFRAYEKEGTYYSTVHNHAKRAMALMDSNDPALDNEFIVSAYNASQYYYAEPENSTYNELMATGNLYLLQDENLRNAALVLYKSTLRLRLANYVLDSDYRERVRRVMPYDVQNAVREQCGDIDDNVTGFSSGIPADCRIEFASERIAAAAVVLRNDPELRSDLTLFLSAFGYAISDAAAIQRQTEKRLDGSYVGRALPVAEQDVR